MGDYPEIILSTKPINTWGMNSVTQKNESYFRLPFDGKYDDETENY